MLHHLLCLRLGFHHLPQPSYDQECHGARPSDAVQAGPGHWRSSRVWSLSARPRRKNTPLQQQNPQQQNPQQQQANAAQQTQLAHQALQAEPSIAALLPCNVVVRSVGEKATVVEAFDPAMMTSFVAEPSEALRAVSEDARARLLTALSAVAAPCRPPPA